MSIKTFLTAAAAGAVLLGGGAAAAQETEREQRNGVDRPGVSNDPGPLPGTATTGTSSETWRFNRGETVDTSRQTYDSTVQSQTQGQRDAFAETAPTPSAATASATADGAVRTELIASQPVPDTPENRARFGQPLSQTGRMTAPRGN